MNSTSRRDQHSANTWLKGASPLAMLLALTPLFFARANAAEISTASTAPVTTATANAGAADDITVTSAGSITPTVSGAAITLNSKNSVTNSGAITTKNVNTSRGIQIVGGTTGTVTNAGSITLTEDYVPVDTDGDGIAEGSAAAGGDRIGIVLSGGTGAFNGNITTSGTISVQGQDSAGISIFAPLNGTLTTGSPITVVGERSVGVRVAGAVSGNVAITGVTSVGGTDAVGVSIESPIAGQLKIQSSVASTAYRVTARPSDAVLALLNADDMKQSGSGVQVLSNVGGGVLIDKPPTLDVTDANGDGVYDNPDSDNDGTADANEGTGSIAVLGSAPALRIGSSTLGQISLGQISAALPYGFVNLGSVGAQGIFNGVSATGALIENASISGGVQNTGGISAQAYSADATGLRIGANAIVPQIINTGGIGGTLTGDTANTARAITIEQGANVASLTNSGTIAASVVGGAGNAVAIRDASNTLRTITNGGIITASHTISTGQTLTGSNTAIDLSTQTIGSSVIQTDSGAKITGDVLFGSGADVFNVSAGTVTGNIKFGAGADQLLINGGATVTGVLSDSDNALAVNVVSGKLALSNTSTLTVSSLNLGSGAVLSERLDPANSANGSITVSGAATLQSGSQIAIDLASVVPTTQTFRLLTAGSITGAGVVSVAQQPFLYSSTTSQTATTLDLTLRRKSATDIGLTGRAATIYEPFIAALPSDAALSTAILGNTTQAGLTKALAQFVPQANGAEVELAQSRVQALQLNAFDRLLHHDALTSQKYFWAQEIGFTANQSSNAVNNGFDAYGAGLSFGVDHDIGKNAFVGIGLAASTGSVDPNLSYQTYGQSDALDLFVHGGARLGPVMIGAWGGGGVDQYKSQRLISFTPDNTTTAVTRMAEGKWDGTHTAGSVRAAVEMKAGILAIRPEVSLNALSVKQKSYTESGAGAGNLTHDDITTNAANAAAIIAFGLPATIEETQFLPELRLGVRQRITSDPVTDTIAFAANPSATFALENNPFAKTAAVIGLSIGASGSFAAAKLEGNADVADGQISASARLVGRIVF